jgi:hypothetical protein
MSNSIVYSQTQQVEQFLQDVVLVVREYLNETNIKMLTEEGTDEHKAYYEGILGSLRRLLVFCEEGLDASRILLKSNPFRKSAAENTLYAIYHQCIAEFFSPKSDLWYENSRSAYTGKNAITFTTEPPASIKSLLASLESKFQTMREDLEYYETDYRTKMMQSK